ncbi:hypothetical protein EGW08_005367, partial [Elysia chlorotica]
QVSQGGDLVLQTRHLGLLHPLGGAQLVNDFPCLGQLVLVRVSDWLQVLRLPVAQSLVLSLQLLDLGIQEVDLLDVGGQTLVQVLHLALLLLAVSLEIGDSRRAELLVDAWAHG